MAKGIGVFGAGRSGTTLVTEVLHNNGVYVGDVNWAHEHNQLRKIDDKLLERFTGAKPNVLPYGNLNNFEIPEQAKEAAKKLSNNMKIEAEKNNKQYWSLKDPRMTLLPELWSDKFEVVVAMFRNPNEVVSSYIGHKFIGVPDSKEWMERYWLKFNENLLDIIKDKQHYIIEFNDGIEDSVKYMLKDLGLDGNISIHFDKSKKHYNDESKVIVNKELEVIYKKLKEMSK